MDDAALGLVDRLTMLLFIGQYRTTLPFFLFPFFIKKSIVIFLRARLPINSPILKHLHLLRQSTLRHLICMSISVLVYRVIAVSTVET
jgi:hypothetical protein